MPVCIKEIYQVDDWFRRKAAWLLPFWMLLRWPAGIACLLGYWIVAPLGIPLLMAQLGAAMAPSPPGMVYWVYFSFIMGTLLVGSIALLRAAAVSFADRVIDWDDLLHGVTLAAGVLLAVAYYIP